jgi:pyochelin synthetase
VLIMLEMTRDHYQIMTSLELMTRVDAATGDFTDERRGQDQTFLTRAQWQRALTGVGAQICLGMPQDGVMAELGLTVFVARLKTDRHPIDVAGLTGYLAGRLPEYMVPSQICVVDRLPLTANGKVDRALLRSWLPRREGASVAPSSGEEPCGDLERRIAGLWADVLRVERVSRTDDFFALGGDSLLAAQLAGQLIERFPEMAGLFFDHVLRLILEERTVASLVAQINQAAAEPTKGEQVVDQPVSLLRTLAAGGGVPTVLVPDAAGGLPDSLVGALADRGLLVGLDVADAKAYLGLDPRMLLERMAADFVLALREAGHRGVRLVAHRTGGSLCVEVARQLVETGVEVESLTLIASAVPACQIDDEVLIEYLFACELGVDPQALGAPDEATVARAISMVRSETPEALPAGWIGKVGDDPGLTSAVTWFTGQARRTRQERLAMLGAALGAADGDAVSAALGERCEVFWHRWSAAAEPETSLYAGDITLVSPRETAPLWAALTCDPAGFWRERCLGELRVAAVPGYPLSCLHPPCLAEMIDVEGGRLECVTDASA